MGTRTLHRDNGIAWACLLALHMLIGWLIAHAMRTPSSSGDDSALQVVFLPPRETAAGTPPPRRRNEAARPNRPAATPHERPTAEAILSMPSTASPPISATFLEQAAASVAESTRIEFAPPDPLADRQARLPGRAGGRFRMRDSLSPEQIVAMAGKLFGGMSEREIRVQLCARNRQNLVNAAGGGDSVELQVELETRRRYCSP